jgi:RNA polymerase sigma factor (sigma-70 family)
MLKTDRWERGKVMQNFVGLKSMNTPASPDDSLPTRHSLLNRLKDWRDDESWQEFFETYWRLIYNFAVKSGLTDVEAQEVVQETLIGVAKRIQKFKPGAAHGSFKSWLLQQTYWRIADQFRKRSNIAPLQCTAHSPASRPQDADTASLDRGTDLAGSEIDKVWNMEWEQHLARTALERVKARASVKQFQMFDLHSLQGLSVGDTARALGTSLAAVYMATSRLKRALKTEVAELARCER